MKLLFCDTFLKEGLDVSVSGTWAVVDFSCPVVLEEIQIVPRGVRVHDQLCADGQIGSTAPGQFRVDFFASDINKDLTSTFGSLCTLDFNESNRTSVVPHLTFPINKLLCTGWYTSITIAVFGAEASDTQAIQAICERKENDARNSRSLLPSSSSGDYRRDNRDHKMDNFRGGPNFSHPSSHFNFNQKRNENLSTINNDQRNFNRHSSYEGRGFRGGRSHDNYPYHDEKNFQKPGLLPTPASLSNQNDPNFSGENGENYQNHFGDKSEGENWQSKDHMYPPNDKLLDKDKKLDKYEEQYQLESNTANEDSHPEGQIGEEWVGEEEEYEEISEEEENMEAMVEEDLLLPPSMMNFNPFDMELYPLTFYRSPQLSPFEIFTNKLQSEEVETEIKNEELLKANKNADELKMLIESMLKICPVNINASSEEKLICEVKNGEELHWVSKLEQLVPLLDNGLTCLLYASREQKIDNCTILISWTMTALQPNNSLAKLIGINVRAMKIGIKLVQKLCETTFEITEALYDCGLVDCLFEILSNKHVASSVKVAAINSIDAITNWSPVMNSFMFGTSQVQLNEKSDNKTGYANLISLALQNHVARVVAALGKLAHKCHIYECTHRVKTLTQQIVVEKIPEEYLHVEEEVEDEEDDEEYNEEEEVATAASEADQEEEEDVVMEVEVAVAEEKNDQRTITSDQNLELRIINESGKRKVMGVARNSHQSESSISSNQTTSGNQGISNKSTEPDVKEGGFVSMDAVFGNTNIKVSDEELCELARCVEEITTTLSDPSKFIKQSPIHVFPLSKQTKTESGNDKELTTLLRYIDGCDVLVSIQALLTLPVVSGHYQLFKACSDFFEQLMSTQKGLLYLVINSDMVLNLVQHLLKASTHLDVETPGTPGYLGTKLAFYVQTMWAVDHIASMLESGAECDAVDEELVHTFKILFSLTYPAFGKNFVSKVLSMDDHISGVIRCLWFPAKLSDPDPVVEEKLDANVVKEEETNDENDKDTGDLTFAKTDKGPPKTYHRVAVNHYASSLLLMLLQRSDDIKFIYKHIKDLRRACLSTSHVIAKSEDISLWLKPLDIKELCGTEADIEKLIELIKMESANLEPSAFISIGPVICSSLRLLCHICSGDTQTIRSRIAKMFSVGGFSVLLTLMSDLHQCLQYACKGIHAVTCALPLTLHNLIASLIKASCHLFYLMLSFLLDASVDSKMANSEKITKVLVAMYSDSYLMLKHTNAVLLDEITDKVVLILALFFSYPTTDNKRATSVIAELLIFAESRCDNFLSATTLLSQLLPLPLPIITPDNPPENVRETALAACTMWSSIIKPHLDHICSILVPLSSSTSGPMIKLVVIIIQQIIDLAPDLASSVISKYVEDVAPLLVSTVITDDIDPIADEISTEKELMLSPEQMTAITTFSYIVSLPAGKATFITMMYDNVPGIMDTWLYATNLETPTEAAASILLLASVVVDCSITMLTQSNNNEKKITSNLPPSDHVKAITVLAFVQLFHSSPLVCDRAFNVLNILVSQSSTCLFVLQELQNNPEGLHAGVENLNKIYDATDTNCISAMYNLTQLLDMLTISNKTKTRPFNNSQLKGILCKDDGMPLKDLENRVKQSLISGKFFQPNVEILESVIDSLSSYNQGFNVIISEDIPVKQSEVVEFTNISLTEQFKNREVFRLGTDDSFLQTRLSITGPSFSKNQKTLLLNAKDERVVQCDLIATAEKFCPGYNLEEEILKVAKSSGLQHNDEESEAALLRRQQKLESYTARMGKTLTFMKRSHGLLVTQQRTCRGRGRGNPINRPFDLFRHRKQNTSRPPSMHVDDFLAADEEQQKNEREGNFKSPPPPPVTSQRRPPLQTFKREFTPRGRGRGGRGRGRGDFRFSRGSYNSPTSSENSSKFRSKSSPVNIRGRSNDRFRGNRTSITSRLGFSPREGFKTNKSEISSWGGHSRAFSQSGLSTRGRGWSKPSPKIVGRGSYSNQGKSWSGTRRGRGYGKPRGKHIRSFTR